MNEFNGKSIAIISTSEGEQSILTYILPNPHL